MQSKQSIDVFIYRVQETGLEVFLINQEEQPCFGKDHWSGLCAGDDLPARLRDAPCIELNPQTNADGALLRQAIALEADWQELPSLRALIYEDFRVAKEKAHQKINDLMLETEQGAFFSIKEAFKRVLPEQYAFLKELRELILEKNSVRYL